MTQPLCLVHIQPDREALARWIATCQPRQASADPGYAWHALLKLVFGDRAPQPFVDRTAVQRDELIGYMADTPDAIRSKLDRPPRDRLAAAAVGMERIRINDLPCAWRVGRSLSFEVRMRPVVRSRTGVRSGQVDEIDVAAYRFQRDPSVSREQAYLDWLVPQIGRNGAATVLDARVHARRRTRVARRTSRNGARDWSTVEGPDVWVRGALQITDGEAFDRLLRRGIGRHRAFGFGCLLIAPPGILG